MPKALPGCGTNWLTYGRRFIGSPARELDGVEMANVVVGVADCQISKSRDQVLVTYALGSCIAVAIHDPVAGVGGLLHYMLPESAISPAKAGENPYMFADYRHPAAVSPRLRIRRRETPLSGARGGRSSSDG